MTITEDSIYFHLVWGPQYGTEECFEESVYAYEYDGNEVIFLEVDAMSFPMNFWFEGDTLMLTWNGEL